MINREKMVLNERIYWTCQYTGPVKVEIIKVLDGDKVLAKTSNPKQAPIERELQFIFNKEEHAKTAMKDWEHAERKRKAEEKGVLSQGEKHAKKLKNKHCRKVSEIIAHLRERGVKGCFVRVTQGTEYSDKKGVLLEQGFCDGVWFDISDGGAAHILDAGDNMFLIDIDSVMTASKIQENQSCFVKEKWWFSYTDKTGNRTWIYFDYKEQGE